MRRGVSAAAPSGKLYREIPTGLKALGMTRCGKAPPVPRRVGADNLNLLKSYQYGVLFVENAPIIIIFWLFIITIFMLMVASTVAAVLIHKKYKEQNSPKMQFLGKLCLTLSIICAVPIVFIAGYVLYLYMG